MILELVTAGESHGPALVAIVRGLPAGLVLDRAAIDDDLRRRQQGYGRSPRQQIETDRGRGLRGPPPRPHARHAAGARRPEPGPRELDVGDEPVAPRGRPAAREQGEGGGDAAAAGSCRSCRRAQVRPRRRPRRARAGECPTHGRASSRPARWRRRSCARSGSRSSGAVVGDDLEARVDEARGCARHRRRDRGGARDRGAARPRLIRVARRPPGCPAGRRADGYPGREGGRDRRRVRARRPARLRGARRDPSRRARPLPRDQPRRRDRGRASRTASRSSCGRR